MSQAFVMFVANRRAQPSAYQWQPVVCLFVCYAENLHSVALLHMDSGKDLGEGGGGNSALKAD